MNGVKATPGRARVAPAAVPAEPLGSGPARAANAWDLGDGRPQSWHNGVALLVEEIPTGRRYHCNDGDPDDDLDDLVFRVEVVAGVEKG